MLKSLLVIILCVLAGFVLSTGYAFSAGRTLADGGRSSYVIVLCSHPSEADKHAADELQKYLGEITGVKLPIESAGPVAARAILIGKYAESERLISNTNWAKLGDEGFVIATVGDKLILAGNKPRGTLYAVYSFLDQELGCRWFAPDATRIPKQVHLTIPNINRTFVPQMEYREVCNWPAFDKEWAAHNYLNGENVKYPGQNDMLRGGNVTYAGKFFVHTFSMLLPPDKYYAKHPDWYAEVDGKRSSGKTAQLCLTNPEVVKAVTAEVRKWLRANPDAKIVSVSQNDATPFCECANCRAVYAEEGGHSGALIRFVNQVADGIKSEFPDVAVDTLAYLDTQQPPTKVRPRSNVIVRLCTTDCCYSHPYASCPRSASFVKDIEAWSKICKRLYIWDYACNFENYLVPYPDLNVLGPNIKFFADHSVKGIFSEGAFTSASSESAELKAYIIARLLWNPDYGADRARDEFLDGYYGPSAPPIREYLLLLQKAVREQNSHFDWNVRPTAPWITPELINHAWELFDKAERLAAGQPEILKRVRIARLPIRYIALNAGPGWDARGWTRKTATGSANWSSKESIDQFLAVASEANVTALGEGIPYAPFRTRILARGEDVDTKLPPPPGTENLPTSSVVDLPISLCHFYQEGTSSGKMNDKTASGRSCAWLVGNTPEWAVQCDIPTNMLSDGKYRIYAIVKVNKTSDAGDAFCCGTYDEVTSKKSSIPTITAKEATTDWKRYDLGEIDAKNQVYVWFCGIKDSTSVSRILIDRIYLVKERSQLTPLL